MPQEGQELREHLAQKYGTSPQQSQGARQRLTQLGESLGFHFDYYDGMRIYNTFFAHQLLHWAAEQERQTELKLALFEAFFSRRENVGDLEVLAVVAGRVGLDSDEARRVLAGGIYAQEVRSEQARWLEREVHAVPMFFLNGGYGIPGAQESATFLRVFEKLLDRVPR
jgi:predicted DsbA family dithiol-disulfide isomerase